jgi:hypothetical protein
VRFVIATRFFLSFIFCVSLTSCNFQQNTLPSPVRPVTAAAKTGTTPFEKYVAEINSDLAAGRFTSLDSTAARLRVSKERFPGGAWKLNALYAGLQAPPARESASDAEWQTHLAKLQTWVDQVPNSITARVALGDALVNYAWSARGQGYADTVTERGARLFEERSELARQVLDDAAKLDAKCPHWYVAMLRIGLGTGLEQSHFNKLFDEAAALEPTYYYFHRVKAMYLMPRWYGEQGDWEKFADESAKKVGGDAGAILYYMIVSHMRERYGTSFFARNQVSWQKTKEGFDSLERSYGVDSNRLNEVCLLSVLAEDQAAAKNFFDRIGENWSATVWQSKNKYDVYKAWANHR